MKKTVVHHIVYSTKGGCGKTAFSLCLSCTNLSTLISKICDEDGFQGSKMNYNYYFDLDFLGTSVMECLPIFESSDAKIQDLIFNRLNVNNIKNIDWQQKDLKIYVVPADKNQKEKNNFQVKRKHTPLLRYDEFRHEMSSIISDISTYVETEATDSEDYILNYIYDLPPNSDGYTEAFFEEIFKKTIVKEEKIILYILFNNHAMLMSNIYWLKYFLNEDRIRNCNVVFVYTENLSKRQELKAGAVFFLAEDEIKSSDLKLNFYNFKNSEELSKLYNEQESFDYNIFGSLKLGEQIEKPLKI